MGYYDKIKKDFSFRNIKLKGISCYEGDGTAIRVTVTGTAQMIRQIIKNKYPKYNEQGTWVKTSKFANGDSIDVYLNRFPEDIYVAITNELEVFDSYAVNHRNATRIILETDDGMIIDAYTKYLMINNVPPYDAKEKEEPAPDWEKILKTNKKLPKKNTPMPKKNYNFDKGELLKECAGWDVYKKTLPDGRLVYNAYKKKETSSNKEDWNAIKGDIYTETGFKWSRFGFEKWGQIASESMVIQTLCNIFAKYYVGKEEPKEESKSEFVYGSNWNEVPNNYGAILIETLKSFGFEILEVKRNYFSIFKLNVDLTIDISDNGGEFNVEDGATKDFITSVAYTFNNNATRPYELAKVIEEIYIDKSQPKQEEKINEDYKSLPANPKLEYCKIRSAEGLNVYVDTFPKTFQSFTALTKYIADNIGKMTKQGEGYDKHYVQWKWTFQEKEGSDRWDVSESEANPLKYPNLYASEKLRSLCYYAWAKDGASDIELEIDDDFFAREVGKDGLELSSDQFITMLTDYLTYYKTDDNSRFDYLTPESRLERFKDVYPKLIAIFEEKEESKDTIIEKTQKLNKAIAGLTILANKGNEKARKGILGLEIILKNINK